MIKTIIVCAITETSVTVVTNALETAPTEEDFTVTIGEDEVTVTAVAEGSADNSYVLTVELTGKEGVVSVNGTAAEKASDFVAPTIVETVAQSATVFDVKFSEKVTKTTAETIANYDLRYAVGQAKVIDLATTGAAKESAGVNAIVEASAILLEDGQTVRISIKTVAADTTGFENGGLVKGANYQVKATGVKDEVGNNSSTAFGPTFAGTNVSDSTAATVLTGNYNSTTGNLSLEFDKAVTAADLSSVTLTAAGKETVSLAGLTPTVDGNKVTVDAKTLADAIAALGTTISIKYVDGSFTDVNGNTVAPATKELTVTEGLKITSAAYNEESNVLTLKFTDLVDIAKLADDLSAIKVAGTALPTADVKLINTSNSNEIQLQLPAEWTVTTGATVVSLETAARTNLTKTDGVVVEVADSVFTAVGETTAMTTAAGKTTLKNIEYTKDETAPTVSSVKLEGLSTAAGKVTVKFAEKVAVSSIKEADLAFYLSDDTELKTVVTDLSAITVAAVTGGTNTADYTDTVTFTLTATEAAKLNTEITTNKKSVVLAHKAKAFIDVNAVEVVAGTSSVETLLENAELTDIAKITTTATGSKVITIQVANVNDGTKVIPLDKATAEDKANYSIVPTNGGAAVPVEKVTLSSDANTVTVYLTEATTASKGYTVTVSNVKNQAGSLLVDKTVTPNTEGKFVTSFNGTAAATDKDVSPTLVSTDVDVDGDGYGKFSAGDKITIDFKEPISLAATAKAADFVLAENSAGNGTPTFGSTASVKVEGGSKVVITLGAGANIKATNQVSLAKATSNVLNYDGTKLGFAATAIANPVVDAPVITGATYTDANQDGTLNVGDEILVTFSAKVTNSSVAVDPVAALNDDFKLGTATYTTALAEDGKSAVLTLTAVGDFVPGTTAITVNTDGTKIDLAGTWTTKLKDATTALKVAKSDSEQPELHSAKYVVKEDGTKTVVLQFSEKVNVSGAFGDNFTILSTNGVATGTLVGTAFAVNADDKTQVIVTLDGTDFVAPGVTQFQFKPATSTVKDANGNVAKFTTSVFTIAE